MKRIAFAISGAIGLFHAGFAAAQEKSFYLDRLYMAGAPGDGVALWRTELSEDTRIFGQLGVGFALNPFRVDNHIENEAARARASSLAGAPVTSQLITYMNFGVEIAQDVSLQASLPFVLFQDGNATNAVGGDAVEIDPAALMDFRLGARWVFLRTERLGLGIGGDLYLPVGNEHSWAGDDNASGLISLGADYDFDGFEIAANTGVHIRPPAGVNDFRQRHDWRWAVGAFIPLRDNQLRIGGEIFGSTGIGDETAFSEANSPIEWMAEGRIALSEDQALYLGGGGGTRISNGIAPDFRLVGLVGYSIPIAIKPPPPPKQVVRSDYGIVKVVDTDGDKIPDDMDLCPTIPEDGAAPNRDDGCPAPADRDKDGIVDEKDKCPDQAEDFDSIDDRDGCPETDADGDTIADEQDACPKEPGVRSEVPGKNGCPRFISRDGSQIQILQQVQFATGKATILAASFEMLDEIAKLLDTNAELKVSVEGHTDDRGADAPNQALSQSRAEAVMTYLVGKGVAKERLSAKGFGETAPIEDNASEAGRQKNRRVEFHIVE